jgi:hypothetical protein
MSACRDVQVWMTSEVQVPVMGFLERAKELCEEARQRIEEHVSQPVENWVAQQERRCRELPWWNPARWFCEIATILVRVVTWVVVTVVKWVVHLVCRIVTEVVSIVVGFVLKVVKWLVTTLVCLFTEPLEALKALRDLWMAIVQLVDDVFDLAIGLLSAVEGILADVEALLGSLADYLGPVGNVIFGLLRRIVHVVRDVVNIVSNVVDGVRDVVVGIVSLNPCQMLAGITAIGVGVGRLSLAGIRLVPGIVTGPRETFDHDALQDIVTEALTRRFVENDVRLARSIERCAVGSVPMGVPFTADPRRYFLSSSSDAISLRQLHSDGTVNLFELAGYLSGCRSALSWPRAEVVYAGSDVPVTYGDIDAFLRGERTPPFRVYAQSTQVLTRYLEVARRKAQQLGIRLYWRPFGDIEITRPTQLPQDSSGSVHAEEFAAFGRTGVGDDLSVLPSLALFWYDESGLSGLTSWFRPTVGGSATKSGVSFRDRQPEWLFQWVLVHEMGHYWGLDHTGHDGIEFIMFSPRESNSAVTGGTAVEYLLMSGEPRFTLDDARTAWDWITTTAADSVLP